MYLTTYHLITRSILGFVKVYGLFSFVNDKSCCEQYRFQLEKGERWQWAQGGYSRAFGLISTYLLDDLQIVVSLHPNWWSEISSSPNCDACVKLYSLASIFLYVFFYSFLTVSHQHFCFILYFALQTKNLESEILTTEYSALMCSTCIQYLFLFSPGSLLNFFLQLH